MKHQQLSSALGAIVLTTSSVWIFQTSAHAVTFTPPPGSSAPSQATGGASRGTVNFQPPAGQGSPSQATGGASRGDLFVPAAGQGSPSQATGGASRDGIFTPAPGNGSPSQATGGASRDGIFTPAPGNGSPSQAAGGASRERTYALNPSIVGAGSFSTILALLPQSYFGTTVSERPTVLVYLPASRSKEMIFSLKDQAGNLKHQIRLPVSGTAGIVAITLPAEAAALEVGKHYQWFLALMVDGRLSPNTPYVDGWVQRIQPNAALAAALQNPDALQRAKALGAQGVWYDCVATLATLRTAQPNSAALAKDWTDLLVSVGLPELTKDPTIESAQ